MPYTGLSKKFGKFYLSVSVVAFFFMSGSFADLMANSDLGVVLFNGSRLYYIDVLGCSRPAQHGAKIVGSEIVWRWKQKSANWCGWMMEGFSIPKETNNFVLDIVYTGVYVGSSPQVKLLDREGNGTGLLDFNQFEKIDGTRHHVVIPLAAFAMEFSVNPTSVSKIQFDAGYHSESGEIHIQSIAILPR